MQKDGQDQRFVDGLMDTMANVGLISTPQHASSVLGHDSATPVNTSQLLGLDVNVTSDELALGLTTSENYTLRVTYPRASLVARTVYGALRGLETFSQLLQDDLTITAQTIVDWPRFPFRAVRWACLDHSVLLWVCC